VFVLAAGLLLPAPLWVAMSSRRWSAFAAAEDQPKVGAAPDWLTLRGRAMLLV